MRKTALYSIVFASLLLIAAGCGVGRQLQQMANIARCEFRLRDVQNTTLANVNVQQIRSMADLNLSQAAAITGALASNKLPLNFVLNMDVRNPNDTQASMNRFDWILFIDDVEMTNGSVDNRLDIAGNQVNTLPLRINVDLMQALSGRSRDAIINFGLNLAGQGGQPSRMMMKIRPTVMVGNVPLTYPGYINVRTDFTSGTGL